MIACATNTLNLKDYYHLRPTAPNAWWYYMTLYIFVFRVKILSENQHTRPENKALCVLLFSKQIGVCPGAGYQGKGVQHAYTPGEYLPLILCRRGITPRAALPVTQGWIARDI